MSTSVEGGSPAPSCRTAPSRATTGSISGLMKPLLTPVGVHRTLPSGRRAEMLPSLADTIPRVHRARPTSQISARSLADHWDSRAGDPNLHTQLVIANKVQGPHGAWLSVDSRAPVSYTHLRAHETDSYL